MEVKILTDADISEVLNVRDQVIKWFETGVAAVDGSEGVLVSFEIFEANFPAWTITRNKYPNMMKQHQIFTYRQGVKFYCFANDKQAHALFVKAGKANEAQKPPQNSLQKQYPPETLFQFRQFPGKTYRLWQMDGNLEYIVVGITVSEEGTAVLIVDQANGGRVSI